MRWPSWTGPRQTPDWPPRLPWAGQETGHAVEGAQVLVHARARGTFAYQPF